MEDKRNKIISIIQQRGPILPGQVTKEINMSLLFTSALFAEMVREKILKLSYLKIGSSPLYFLQGQEQKLEKFINHLQPKEREAFELLKRRRVEEDIKFEPAHRVAIRDIKDFAIPLKINYKGQERFFWYFHTVPKGELEQKIKFLLEKPLTKERSIKSEVKRSKIKPKVKEKIEEFKKEIYNYLKSQGIEILEELKLNAKEANMVVSVASDIGKLRFLAIIKDKKTINKADLSLALQQGQTLKLPVLFLAKGSLTKKTKNYVDSLKGYLLFKEL